MGGFFLICARPGRQIDADETALKKAFAELGFACPVMIDELSYRLYVYPKFQHRDAPIHRFRNGDFAFACGTLLYDGRIGSDAAAALYEAGRLGSVGGPEPMGHYATIIKRGGRTEIRADDFGAYHIYFNRDIGVVTSSFYALSRALRRVTLSRQSTYEYVFNGVVSGNATLFDEISVPPIRSVLTVDAGGVDLVDPGIKEPAETEPSDFAASIKQSIALLDRYFAPIAAHFGDRTSCALSGGYDSRLILAMLRRHGVAPQVYVYGRSDEQDVRIAQAIAVGENFKIATIDKNDRPIIPPAEFSEVVQRNLLAVDGYGYAGIFHNGAEVAEAANRVADDGIAFNGGGGEIFRNYFYLIGRQYDLRSLLWTFYAQFDPAGCTDRFSEEDYYVHMEQKIQEIRRTKDRNLQQTTLHWLYHCFRCRSWDGKSDSSNSRFGYTAMPFLEPAITNHASLLPLRWRNHGRYEAELIRTIDPCLAAYQTNYGHDFSAPPPRARILQDYLTYFRPPLLRRYTFRLKHRRPQRPRTGYLATEYQDAILPHGTPIMGQLFRLDRVPVDQFARIFSLEYLLQQIGTRVDTDF